MRAVADGRLLTWKVAMNTNLKRVPLCALVLDRMFELGVVVDCSPQAALETCAGRCTHE